MRHLTAMGTEVAFPSESNCMGIWCRSCSHVDERILIDVQIFLFSADALGFFFGGGVAMLEGVEPLVPFCMNEL